MKIDNVSEDKTEEFLGWLAGIVLAGYYMQARPEDPSITYEDWEREVLVDVTKLWLQNDKGGSANWEDVYQFMFDNRRL
jgi:hypothetical protein